MFDGCISGRNIWTHIHACVGGWVGVACRVPSLSTILCFFLYAIRSLVPSQSLSLYIYISRPCILNSFLYQFLPPPTLSHPPSQALSTPTPALSLPSALFCTARTLSAITQVPQETSEAKAATHRSSAQRREPRDTPTQSLCLFFCF